MGNSLENSPEGTSAELVPQHRGELVRELFAISPSGIALHGTSSRNFAGIEEYGLNSRMSKFARDPRINHAYFLHPDSKFNGQFSVDSATDTIIGAAIHGATASTFETGDINRKFRIPVIVLFQVESIPPISFLGQRARMQINKAGIIHLEISPVSKERIIGAIPVPSPFLSHSYNQMDMYPQNLLPDDSAKVDIALEEIIKLLKSRQATS